MKGEPIEGWHDLVLNYDGDIKYFFLCCKIFFPDPDKKKKTKGEVNFRICLKPAGSSQEGEEDDCYFPMTRGNAVTLYQDADTPPLPCFQGVTTETGEQ